jgi:hypothetical protein
MTRTQTQIDQNPIWLDQNQSVTQFWHLCIVCCPERCSLPVPRRTKELVQSPPWGNFTFVAGSATESTLPTTIVKINNQYKFSFYWQLCLSKPFNPWFYFLFSFLFCLKCWDENGDSCVVSNWSWRVEVAIGRVGSGLVSLIKKIIGSRVRFGSTWSGSGRVLGRTLSGFFGFLVISGHSGPSRDGF